jgi:hypothetical protein
MQISAVKIRAGDDTAQINCNPNMCLYRCGGGGAWCSGDGVKAVNFG